MKGKFIITLLFAMLSIVGYAKDKSVVWNEIAVEANKYTDIGSGSVLDIRRVEFADDETRIMMHVEKFPNSWIKFVKGTTLRIGEKRYALKGCDGMELDKEVYFKDSNWKADLIFHFEPLPNNTSKFDFIEGDNEWDFKIFGVSNGEYKAKLLFPSNWRNDKTGDWVIGFYDYFAIYDCKFWNYKKKVQKGDKYSFVLENDGKELTVSVDKYKEGRRSITIGKTKHNCSFIKGNTLPDYPTKDTSTTFKDSHYVTDTVTFIGWLKDMPDNVKAKGNEFDVSYMNIFTNDQQSFYGKIDSLGRFVVKCPLINTSTVMFDWTHIYVSSVFEPGETYLMLYDFKEGKKLFMGNNSRLQNEMMAHYIYWLHNGLGEREIDAHKQFEDIKAIKEKTMDLINGVVAAHPTLSDRYINYMKDMCRTSEGRDLMQGRFYIKDRNIPDDYLQYVGENHWQKRSKPYTLHRDFCTFTRDYIDQLVFQRYSINKGRYFYTPNNEAMIYILKKYRDAGNVSITDDEFALMQRYADGYKELIIKQDDEKPEENQRLSDEFDAQEYVKQYNSLIEREDIHKIITEEVPLLFFYNTLCVLDSIGCDKDLRDIITVNNFYNILDHSRQPLNERAVQYIEENVTMPAAKAIVLAENDKYIAIQSRDISKSPSLKSAEDLANMSDGEKILRKIIEPYKGKIILLDIWGTWCGPCKEALSHSAEEYERLKDFDIVYLYLADNSSDESWKNVIKEYNVTGDNVVHYNLPQDQQKAIENFLGVHSFPTYKLIDRNGNILDVNADPRDLNALARLLEQMK